MTSIMKPGDLSDIIKDPKAPVEFKYLNEIIPYKSVTLLLYGGVGTGKTRFLATARGRTLIVNIGDGIVTIQSPIIAKKYYQAGFPIVVSIREEIDPATGLFKDANALDQVKSAIEWAMDKFPDKFDTIAVDDATMFNMFAMNKGLELNEEFNRSKTLETGKKVGGFIPAVQDFQAEMGLVEQFVAQTISFCKAEEKHFIFTAHERHIFKKIRDASGKPAGEELDKIRPGFTGRTFPDDIPMYFDLVWNMEVVPTGQGPVYRANTQNSSMILAKSRYPEIFKQPEINPDFLDMVARIKKSWDAGNLVDTQK